MHKRIFIIITCFIVFFSAVSTSNAASGFIKYKPGVVQSALDKGQTVFVDFYASWCGTCRTQSRVINKLLRENPEFKSSMVFVRVNWDKYKNSPISTDNKIRRRSTLLVLRGNKKLGKVVAKTSESSIKRLLKKGL